MSAPFNVDRAVARLLKNPGREVSNERLLLWAGGSDIKWGSHLSGARVAAIVSACNTVLAERDWQIVSQGGLRWLMVTNAEAHRRAAQFNLERINGAYRRAYDHVLAICQDERVEKKVKRDARAWLSLFENDLSRDGLQIMREWADELSKKMLPPPRYRQH